jgi:hypothetical protein
MAALGLDQGIIPGLALRKRVVLQMLGITSTRLVMPGVN